jgi:hypothetical protein
LNPVIELLGRHDPVVRRNGNEQVREGEMAKARVQVRELARAGLSPGEIEANLDGSFNRVERDLLWLVASHEVDRARAMGRRGGER